MTLYESLKNGIVEIELENTNGMYLFIQRNYWDNEDKNNYLVELIDQEGEMVVTFKNTLKDNVPFEDVLKHIYINEKYVNKNF